MFELVVKSTNNPFSTRNRQLERSEPWNLQHRVSQSLLCLLRTLQRQNLEVDLKLLRSTCTLGLSGHSSPNPDCSASSGVRCHRCNKPQASHSAQLPHISHHVRTNPPTSPCRGAHRRSTNSTHLHIVQLTRRRDARSQRTHPHTAAHRNPTRLDNSSPARFTLPHIATPHADTIATALALPFTSTSIRDPQPLHPRGAKPMDTLLDTDVAEQRAHIHILAQDLVAG
jgi:hypothetical protein